MCWTSHMLLFGERWAHIRAPPWVAGFAGASTDRRSAPGTPARLSHWLGRRLCDAPARRRLRNPQAPLDARRGHLAQWPALPLDRRVRAGALRVAVPRDR